MKNALYVSLGLLVGVAGMYAMALIVGTDSLPLLGQPTPMPTAVTTIAAAPYEAEPAATPAAQPEATAGPGAALETAPTTARDMGVSTAGEQPVWTVGYVDETIYTGWQRYMPTLYCEGCPSVFERRFMPVPLRYEGARGYIVDFGPREHPVPWNLNQAIEVEDVPVDSWQGTRTYHLAGVVMPGDDVCAHESFLWVYDRLNDIPAARFETNYSEAQDYDPKTIDDRLTRLKTLTGPRPSYPLYLWDQFGASLNELMVASGYALAAPAPGGAEGKYANAQRYAQAHNAGCLW